MNRNRKALALPESDLYLKPEGVTRVICAGKRVIKSRRFQRPICARSVATMRSA